MIQGQPIPVNDVVSKKDGMIGNAFLQWLQWLVGLVMASPRVLTPAVDRTALVASVASTSLAPITTSGVYELSYYVRVTTPATTSSSIAVNFAWNDGVAQTVSSSALTGNTTTTWGTGSYLVWMEASTTPTYSTTYASVGATSMSYRLSVVLKQIMA